ncbi:MAG: ATP-binding cassette domain-containing protein [Geminicoccaceae bacterium]|nr:ATP-binding cassette domain-containing protein [Geminicoccaceae bacterium]
MSLTLEVRQADVVRRGRQRVAGASLAVPQGAFAVLLGGTGAGKSALLEAVLPGDGLRAGTVRAGGVDIKGMDPFERRRHGLGIAFQVPALLAPLTVREHLLLGADAGNRLDAALEHRLMRLLPELEGLGGLKPPALDRRQRRIVDLARALCGQPRLLLVDELALDLGPERAVEILLALKQGGRTLLAAERYAGPLLRVADLGFVMVRGEIVGEGPAEDLRDDPDVVAACVGEMA